MKERTLIVCRATSGPSYGVIPGSLQYQCSACQCGIWVAPATLKDMLSQRGDIAILCAKCSITEINSARSSGQPIDYMPLTDNQKADVINSLPEQSL